VLLTLKSDSHAGAPLSIYSGGRANSILAVAEVTRRHGTNFIYYIEKLGAEIKTLATIIPASFSL
jgi:hypothetical protein